MGHARDNTMQDIIIRFKRMQVTQSDSNYFLHTLCNQAKKIFLYLLYRVYATITTNFLLYPVQSSRKDLSFLTRTPNVHQLADIFHLDACADKEEYILCAAREKLCILLDETNIKKSCSKIMCFNNSCNVEEFWENSASPLASPFSKIP